MIAKKAKMPATDHGITNRPDQDEYSETEPAPNQTGDQYRQYEIATGVMTQAIQRKASDWSRTVKSAKTADMVITTKNPDAQDKDWMNSSIF